MTTELTDPWAEPVFGSEAAAAPAPAPAPVVPVVVSAPVVAPTPQRRLQGFSPVPLPQEIGEITGVNKPARIDRRLIALAAMLAVGLVGGGIGLGVYFAKAPAGGSPVTQAQVERELARIDAVKKGFAEARAAAGMKPTASAKTTKVAPREAAAPVKATTSKHGGTKVASAKPEAAPVAAPAPAPAPAAAPKPAPAQRSAKFSDEPNDPE